MKPVLDVQRLNKRYPGFQLQNIEFQIPENCITGFIGVNGAGKTTTIKSILGLLQIESGNIRIFGKEMTANPREIKNKIGVVFDEGYFYGDLTLSQMASIVAPAYRQWDKNIFNIYIQRFNLPLNQKITTLSKGQRMKFALSLALSHNADLLIMDEPTSGLDPLIRVELMDILLEYVNQEGKSVLFSTHIMSDLEKVADTLILIDKGKLLFHQDKDMLLDSHCIIKGDPESLTSESKQLFLSLRKTKYSYTGLTNQRSKVCALLKDATVEKPTIEDIILGYIGGGSNDTALG